MGRPHARTRPRDQPALDERARRTHAPRHPRLRAARAGRATRGRVAQAFLARKAGRFRPHSLVGQATALARRGVSSGAPGRQSAPLRRPARRDQHPPRRTTRNGPPRGDVGGRPAPPHRGHRPRGACGRRRHGAMRLLARGGRHRAQPARTHRGRAPAAAKGRASHAGGVTPRAPVSQGVSQLASWPRAHSRGPRASRRDPGHSPRCARHRRLPTRRQSMRSGPSVAVSARAASPRGRGSQSTPWFRFARRAGRRSRSTPEPCSTRRSRLTPASPQLALACTLRRHTAPHPCAARGDWAGRHARDQPAAARTKMATAGWTTWSPSARAQCFRDASPPHAVLRGCQRDDLKGFRSGGPTGSPRCRSAPKSSREVSARSQG